MNKRKFDKKVTLSLAVLLFFLSIPTNVLAEGRTIQLPSSSVLYESSELFSDVLLPDLHYVHEEDEEASQSTYQFNPEELLINEDLIPQGFDDYSNIGRRGNGRLIGFDGPNALANDDSLIPVIVIFNQDPIAVQLARAAERGIAPRFDVATLVERERQLFYYELDELSVSLSSHNPLARNLHNSFTITREFSQAFNGVSMTLPSHMVSYLAAFQSVAMVFPDEILQLDPIIEHDPLEEDLIAFSANNPAGVRLGRERMNAHILHEMGIRGQGLLMAVIDTGLYYYHPAFEGSFPTASDMAARGVSIPDDYLLYLDGQGYFFVGRDMLHNLAGGSWMNNPEGNDPMETSPMNFPNASGSWSRHGTHVAAIALGRETNGMIGLAPEALGIHYRVLGPGGGTNSDILAAMEHAAYYMRVDIINLSLGPTGATPLLEPLTITINNLSISTDAIFVVAAGNSGSNYNTSWGGGNSSFAINVANFAETPARSGMYLSSDSLDDAELSFFSGSLSIRELQNGNLVSTAPGSAYTEVGEMRIFALPATPGSPYGAGLDAETAPNVGAGTLNDFEALEAYYGREALLGGWLLVRRGEPFVVTASRAESLNMAGVILINTPTQAMIIASGDDYSLPLVATHSADGRTLLANILASNTDYAMFTLTGFTNSNIPLRVALGSSRGPAPTSFEINPEIGAHGSTVIAAVPPWDVGWSLSPNTADVTFHANGGNILPSEFIFNADERSSFYDRSYLPLSGTSMASPMVAGGVALMLQYNRENSSRDWNRSEIRARITNNAIPVHHAEQATGLAPAAGVFEAGAGQADLLAAIQNDTVVLGYFDAILSITETTPVRTGAFSFGGVNLHYAQGSSATSSLEAVIINTSNQARTYTFDYSHITNARRSVVGSTLNLPPSVTVPANSETNFSIEIDIPIDLPLGHHEGFVEVLLGATVVARIPFAAVTYYDYTPPALVHDAFLARSIFSANPDRQNTLGAQLQTYATIYDTFWGDLYIFGIDEYGNEVIMPGIGDDFGFIGERDSPQSINEARVRYAVNLLTIPDDPTIWVEGDYVAKWVISHPGSGEHDITHMLYFSIDNTPPEFTNVEVSQANEGITVTGTVNDAFLNEAASRGMTNDIWLTNSEITLANSLAIWALAGTNTENNRPIRATVQNNGRFSVNLPEATMDSSIILWAIDNYTPMPHIFNQLHDNTNISSFTRQDYFIPNGLLIADAYADYLAFGYRLGGGLLTTPNTSFFRQHNWVGGNVATYIINETPEALIVDNVFLARSIISTSPERQHSRSGNLTVYFTPNAPFFSDRLLYRIEVDGTPTFVADLGGLDLPIAGAYGFGEQHKLDLFTFAANPNLLPEGDYVLIWDIMDVSTETLQISHRLYFSIDNTPPQFEDVVVKANPYGDGALVTGRVSDEFMDIAIARNQTNDIWTSPYDAEISISNNLAVWVSNGDNSPIRLSVESDGTFTVLLENVQDGEEITLWAIDNFSLVPHFFQLTTGATPWNAVTTLPARENFFSPNTILAEDSLGAYIQLGWLYGISRNDTIAPQLLFSNWIGNNVATYTLSFGEEVELRYTEEYESEEYESEEHEYESEEYESEEHEYESEEYESGQYEYEHDFTYDDDGISYEETILYDDVAELSTLLYSSNTATHSGITAFSSISGFINTTQFESIVSNYSYDDETFIVSPLLNGIVGRYLPSAEKDGYIFIGWNTERNGEGIWFTSNTPITTSIDVFAVWEKIPIFDITVNNVATGTVNPTSSIAGVQVTLIPGAAPVNHTFGGWTIISELGTETITGNTFTMPAAHVTATVIWNFTGGNNNQGGNNNNQGSNNINQWTPTPSIPPQVGSSAPSGTWTQGHPVIRETNLVPPITPTPNGETVNGTVIRVGYISGFTDGTFRADASLTRAEMVQIMFNLLDDPARFDQSFAGFDDVSEDGWYFEAISYFANAGILVGFGDGTFRPNDYITMAQFAQFMYGVFGLGDRDLNSPMQGREGHWSNRAVASAFDAQFTAYPGENFNFNEDAEITRAGAVTFINQYLGHLPVVADIINYLDANEIDRVFTDVERDHWAFYQIFLASN